MVIFEGMPYPVDMVYIKVAGVNEVLSLPFTEALAVLTNVSFDYKASLSESNGAETIFVVKGNTDKEKNKVFKESKTSLIKILQRDIYVDRFKVTDVIIQPMDELLTTAVKSFINL